MKKVFKLYCMLMIALGLITYENNRVDTPLTLAYNSFLAMTAIALTFGLLMVWAFDEYLYPKK